MWSEKLPCVGTCCHLIPPASFVTCLSQSTPMVHCAIPFTLAVRNALHSSPHHLVLTWKQRKAPSDSSLWETPRKGGQFISLAYTFSEMWVKWSLRSQPAVPSVKWSWVYSSWTDTLRLVLREKSNKASSRVTGKASTGNWKVSFLTRGLENIQCKYKLLKGCRRVKKISELLTRC